MAKGLDVKIICVESIDSTHRFMCEAIRSDRISENTALYALEQTSGIGSRDNEWTSSKGNLHLNFCLNLKDVPTDLSLASASIYYAFLMKDLLSYKGSKIWLKWPNDFYIEDKKIGGVLSAKIKDFIVVGMGLNLKNAPKNASLLDINIDLAELLDEFVKEIEKKISWKFIFSKYVVEFEKSKEFSVHLNGHQIPLKEASLYEDGSILLCNQRIYSLR